ncbi:ROK family transcriptional regulator [Staphylococcus nepalensis]|uniref:ROK family transcriptional regulator n=1 Tax=Staphylococcus nepalensis TaxID=214473 RepID=UPI00301938B0
MEDKDTTYFLVLSLIKKHDAITRTYLADLTGLSNTSIGKITNALLKDDWIIEKNNSNKSIGRKPKLLSVNPDGLYSFGIEIEKEYTQLAIISFDGKIIDSQKLTNKFNPQTNLNCYLDWLSQEIIALINNANEKVKEKIIAVGVSVPGSVDVSKGIVINSSQLQWHNIELKTLLENKLNWEVYVENHVRSILIAEKLYGKAKHKKNTVCLYIGSGVGASIMVNGEVARGANNSFGEIGHMIIDPNGPLCECGRLGCLQTYLSLEAIKKQYGDNIHILLEDYYNGNKRASVFINKMCQYLKIAIANILCIYNPNNILLCGPLFYDYDIFSNFLHKSIEDYVWEPLRNTFKLENVEKGRISAALGASSLVIDEFFKK